MGNFKDAAREFTNSVRFDPKDHDAWQNLGSARRGLKQPALAEEAYRNARNLKADDQVSWNNLGNTFLGQGKVEDAIAAFRKALELKPDDATAHHNLAWELLRIARRDLDLADPEAIITAARKAVELTKEQNAKMLRTLVLALGYGDEPEEAVKVAKKALKLMEQQENPDDQLKSDIERALKRFQRAAGNQ